MLSKRIIPCLDVHDGRVVKGVQFVDLVDAGDPVEVAKAYASCVADEIVFLDITASHENRSTIVDLVEKTAQEIFIPLTVGGGIRTIEDFRRILRAGADKVSVNSAAIETPELIQDAARKFGSQCVVVAIDAKYNTVRQGFDVYSHGGRQCQNLDVITWAKEVEERGAGEILLTSMDQDGTKAGYDVALTRQVSEAVSIPVIASGGAGDMSHFKTVLTEGKADAALAASLFHFHEVDMKALKTYLKKEGIPMRMY